MVCQRESTSYLKSYPCQNAGVCKESTTKEGCLLKQDANRPRVVEPPAGAGLRPTAASACYRALCVVILATVFSPAFSQMQADDDVHIQGHYLEWYFAEDEGGILSELHILGDSYNLAGEGGLAQEGFGVGSHYVPNRRLNETLEILEQTSPRPALRYQYDCDGPNIKGLHVSRMMEPLPDEASMRITWTVENKGDESQWITPWIRNELRASDMVRIDLPTLQGVLVPEDEAYFSASRNWSALTNTKTLETVYTVSHADHTHAFLTLHDGGTMPRTVQTAYVPRILKPGEAWTTLYRLNVVRGLEHIDFATDELAMQLEYRDGRLTALFAAVKPMENVHIEARIVAENKRVWRLPRKRFDVSPSRLARCTYDWEPPGDGAYDFMAQLSYGNETIALGADTGSPHGGIDTQFVVGTPKSQRMAAWTDAPHLLDRGPRVLERPLAVSGPTQLWFASSLEKVFREDAVDAGGAVNPIRQIRLARNEHESFQVCLRPPTDMSLAGVRVVPGPLMSADGSAQITEQDIDVYRVQYHHIGIPSHYEGPTGWWPDALPPAAPFTAEAGVTSPLWITVFARPELPAGVYRGSLTITASNAGPWELGLEVEVHDFQLPAMPALKTDFGFSMESLSRYAERLGADPDVLARHYLENALSHRVTLRELCQLPRESADYGAALRRYEERLEALQRAGVSTYYVPSSLIDVPAQLEAANAFVKRNKLEDRAFTQLAYEPEPPAWDRVLEKMQTWKNYAPDIPITVSAMGLRPFIPPVLDIWSLHAQVLDTTHNAAALNRTSEGGRVWWYVNHTPPRPYGNFFVDFAAIEHRILFWQAWALGMRGMQYWSVNFWPNKGDPMENLLDITPVNGDGLLVYPQMEGPVNSIRWEVIRDGIEDYDYMALFMERVRALRGQSRHEALLQRVSAVYNLEEIVPSLVTFTREPEILLNKRDDIARMILEMDRALKSGQ